MSKTIIIDPGHGGTDPGANGFGIREKDWNLRISLYQYKRLKELGADVAITRTTDVTLDSVPRTNLIKGKYDYCISNHWNAFNGQARGIETIHSVHGGHGLANDLADALVATTGLPLRRVFKRYSDDYPGSDYYFMHRLTKGTTTVIIEYGFIDNKADNDWFGNDANFYKAAEAVIEVICKHIGIPYKSVAGALETKGETMAAKKDVKMKCINYLTIYEKPTTKSKVLKTKKKDSHMTIDGYVYGEGVYKNNIWWYKVEGGFAYSGDFVPNIDQLFLDRKNSL